MVSHNICLSYWSSVAAGTEWTRFCQWHSCPSLDMFVAKVALLHLVVLGAMLTPCVVCWYHGLGCAAVAGALTLLRFPQQTQKVNS